MREARVHGDGRKGVGMVLLGLVAVTLNENLTRKLRRWHESLSLLWKPNYSI
jgi:hypothetical protein